MSTTGPDGLGSPQSDAAPVALGCRLLPQWARRRGHESVVFGQSRAARAWATCRLWCRNLVCLTGLVLLGGYVYFFMPLVPQGLEILIAEAEVPGVVRCKVTQTPDEPFRVSFWYQYPGQPWVWNYIDHESLFWWQGEIRVNREQHTAAVYHGREYIGLFVWSVGAFWLADDVPDRYRTDSNGPTAPRTTAAPPGTAPAPR